MPVAYTKLNSYNYYINSGVVSIAFINYTSPTNCQNYPFIYAYSAVIAETNTTLPYFISLSDREFKILTADNQFIGSYNIRIICKYKGNILDDSHVWSLMLLKKPSPMFL